MFTRIVDDNHLESLATHGMCVLTDVAISDSVVSVGKGIRLLSQGQEEHNVVVIVVQKSKNDLRHIVVRKN